MRARALLLLCFCPWPWRCLRLLCQYFNANFPLFSWLSYFSFSRKLLFLRLIDNRTSCRLIQSVTILVINKSDSRCAVVRFCYHSYDYRPNWAPLSPITFTNHSKTHRPHSNTVKPVLSVIARANEYVHVHNVRDFPQAMLDSEITAGFLLNGHGDLYLLCIIIVPMLSSLM